MLAALDWVIVVGYFVFIIGFALVITARARRNTGSETSAGYFLAGRNAGWWVIGASLFAANIGSEHLVGLSGAGASSGVATGQFELFAVPCLLILSWLFVPFYIKNGVFTMPEYLEKRFSPAARWYLALISIVAYVLTKISVTIFAGALVFETLMGIPFWTGAVVVVAITGVYTLIGGMRAVLYTDFIQIFIIFLGSALLTGFGLAKLGGWGEMVTIAGPDMMDMWKPMSDPDFPWTGIVFGILIIGVWYWCTDQFIVQRVLSARNIDHARGGALFGAALKILPLFLFVIPGLIAYCLQKEGLMELESADKALPTMIGALLPVGVKGIVVAGLLAALISSLASVFNSCASLVTIDIYQKLVPAATEKRLVFVGRIATVALIACGMLWIPLMKLVSGQLYTYLQSVQAYISPPIAAVFLFGIFWKRINGAGAMAALITGFVLGVGRLVMNVSLADVELTGFLDLVINMNFLHFGILEFVVCVVVMIAVSLVTKPKSDEELQGLSFQTSESFMVTIWSGHAKLQLILSVVLMAMVAAVWIYFS